MSAWQLLIIHASCEKKIDQKHPGETDQRCLCNQLRYELKYEAQTERYRWENLHRRITSQAAWLTTGVKGKSGTVSFEAWSWRQGCRDNKKSCSEKWSKVLTRRTRATPFPEGSAPDQTVLCGNVQIKRNHLILG